MRFFQGLLTGAVLVIGLLVGGKALGDSLFPREKDAIFERYGVRRYKVPALNKDMVEVQMRVIENREDVLILQFEEAALAYLLRPYLEKVDG